MNIRYKTVLVTTLSCVAVALVIQDSIFFKDITHTSQEERRIYNLSLVRHAITQYQYDNGSMPARLSLLTPKYITSNQLAALYPQYDSYNRSVNLPKWLLRPEYIDAFCGYVYFPQNSIYFDDVHNRLKVVLIERPKSKNNEDHLIALMNDDSITSFTINQAGTFLNNP